MSGAGGRSAQAAGGRTVSRCLAFDLEVDTKNRGIRAWGAIRGDTKETFPGDGTAWGLEALDALAEGVEFVLGHNVIAFDLERLKDVQPRMRLLQKPVIDTLRLNPLAFPEQPYHRLVKHYRDGDLVRTQLNDPVADAEIALQVFADQSEALRRAPPDLLTAWHWLCTPEHQGADRALDGWFAEIRSAGRPTEADARAAIGRRLDGKVCDTRKRDEVDAASRWPLAYALAWLSVAGGKSVLSPWVYHEFPETAAILRRLRDTACDNPNCRWCREGHDARKELRRWFGFDGFRPEPADAAGHPLQQSIVEAAMAGRHALGILPTGTGKSLCYQLPALSRHAKTGALTVVLSPLVALMADQVGGMERRGIDGCVTINSLLSMPEREEMLKRVQMGDASMVIIAPEQLRSRGLRRTLEQREIGSWVIDEAHCLSRWGHDFRPDYRYISRFIAEQRECSGRVPPLLCLTATSRKEVTAEICSHFRENLGIALEVFDGGAERTNLAFDVEQTLPGEKFAKIHQLLESELLPRPEGGAIIYCATRRHSEEVADFLKTQAIAADHYHAGLEPGARKEVQERFIDGGLRAIAATNAFGMGIDKPDVRLVVHADIPGSLENYLQEAGRAGRDGAAARCVLLYATDDVERQFGLSARSRLSRREIDGALRALRRLDRRRSFTSDEVVATSGEILRADEEQAFVRDSATDDTRVRTAVAWLEEADLLTRKENAVQMFPSSLRVNSSREAERRLAKRNYPHAYREQLLCIAERLLNAEPDEGVTTDELMGVTGLSSQGVCDALWELEKLGILNFDTPITAYVHHGVQRSSNALLEQAGKLECALIALLRESASESGKGDSAQLHLRLACQRLRDAGLPDPLPERLLRILRGIARDGRTEGGAGKADLGGSLQVRKTGADTVLVTLKREWPELEAAAQLRRDGAARLLEHLLERLPAGNRQGRDILVETKFGLLRQAIDSDLALMGASGDFPHLLDRSLLWLHELEVIQLNKGLAVLRPAMTIGLHRDNPQWFSPADFQPLELHYQGLNQQIHVMKEYAEQGLKSGRSAQQLAHDYFTKDDDAFLDRWFAGRRNEVSRQTTPASWQKIVGCLDNAVQKRVVADPREKTNVLVLAGPGSGKTHMLVHRIAYLLRVRRENPRGILALAYNRHAAVDIRRRLTKLVGADAKGVTVLTCHALAMRLAGASFSKTADTREDNNWFSEVLRSATALLNGADLPEAEASAQRDQLLAGFRWILVDEYQDIEGGQYALISALAGRSQQDEADRLTVFAVGDDDQNIYGFKGASVKYIRQFENDYKSKPEYLVENYRSSGHIVAAANEAIRLAPDRMKARHPIRVNRARRADPQGGPWESRDPIARGRVQILEVPRRLGAQTQAVMAELRRLAALDPAWNWSSCAVIARKWTFLDPVRAYCELHGIPCQSANEEFPSVWQLRETRALVGWARGLAQGFVDHAALCGWLQERPQSGPGGRWYALLREAVDEYALDFGGGRTPVAQFTEWLAEWCREIRRSQQGLLLSTAHRVKGLEFDHVAVLDGGWGGKASGGSVEEERRLLYVAMTRARQTLALARFSPAEHRMLDGLRGQPGVLVREGLPDGEVPPALDRRYLRLPLRDVDLGFAGRRNQQSSVHRAIRDLEPGALLQARITRENRWELCTQDRVPVGRLAQGFHPPEGMRCRSAEVYAVVRRHLDQGDPKYAHLYRSDSWEVVVPELVFGRDENPNPAKDRGSLL